MYLILAPPSVKRTAPAEIDSVTQYFLEFAMALDPTAAVEELYRSEWGRIVATLIRLLGDFDLSEDAVQEAFAAALDNWRENGVPEYPRAWIIRTARHKAIDRIRRQANFDSKMESYVVSGFFRTVEEPEYDDAEFLTIVCA